MAVLFPNRTGQLGIYKTGAPDYIDVSGVDEIDGLQLFASVATAKSWADADSMGIVVTKNSANWLVATATWDETNTYLLLSSIEDSLGTFADTDAVNVYAAPTTTTLTTVLQSPAFASVVSETGTTRTLTASDAGKLIRSYSSSAVTITPQEGLAEGTHFVIAQAGTGLVRVARAGSDSLNGGSANIALGGQFTTGYLVKTGASSWDFYA